MSLTEILQVLSGTAGGALTGYSQFKMAEAERARKKAEFEAEQKFKARQQDALEREQQERRNERILKEGEASGLRARDMASRNFLDVTKNLESRMPGLVGVGDAVRADTTDAQLTDLAKNIQDPAMSFKIGGNLDGLVGRATQSLANTQLQTAGKRVRGLESGYREASGRVARDYESALTGGGKIADVLQRVQVGDGMYDPNQDPAIANILNARKQIKSAENIDADNQRGPSVSLQFVQGPDGKAFGFDRRTGAMTEIKGPSGEQFVGTQGRPSQGELNSASFLPGMMKAADNFKQAVAATGYQAPDLVTQRAFEKWGEGGFTAGAAREFLANVSPEYRDVAVAMQPLVNTLLYLRSGQAITEVEFNRILASIAPRSGQTKENILQNMSMLEADLEGYAIRAGRALPQAQQVIDRQQTPSRTSGVMTKAQKWEAFRKKGYTPQQATEAVAKGEMP